MVEPGEYLLSHVGFSHNTTPYVVLQRADSLISLNPLGHMFTMQFDMTQRFCRGWHDLATGNDAPCPDNQQVDSKYDQCPACNKRTGFNPAFYHAKTVSPQQEARNQEPHFLYLAYFGDNIIKVGISYANRGKARLLEQGARSALILDTFPTAHIARHYEAKVAALPGLYETLQLAKKIATFEQPHSPQKAHESLVAVRSKIEQTLKVEFTKNIPEHLDSIYFPDQQPQLTNIYNCSADHTISGVATGLLGSLLFCRHQDTPVFLPLKKYIGYRLRLSRSETPLNLPARQTSLF